MSRWLCLTSEYGTLSLLCTRERWGHNKALELGRREICQLSMPMSVPLGIRSAGFSVLGVCIIYISLPVTTFVTFMISCSTVLGIGSSALPCSLRAPTVHLLSPTFLMCCREMRGLALLFWGCYILWSTGSQAIKHSLR